MPNTEKGKGASSLLELSRLYSERCDFPKAIDALKKAETEFLQEKDFAGFLQVINSLLRVFAEMQDQQGIEEYKEKLQTLVIKEKFKLTPRTYYTLGLCAAYKNQKKIALEYLEKSLAEALAEDNKEDICYAINGIAIVYFQMGRYEDALKEIYNLQVFFQVMPLPDIQLSVQILNGHILRKMGKHDQALEVFWKSYEELKVYKNFYLHINLLYSFGCTYLDLGDKNLARMYLNLAKKSIDPEVMKATVAKIDEKLKEAGGVEENQYDLVFDAGKKSIKEKVKGKVDFKNQFILLDLLKLFLKEPGSTHSKEEIVEKIWKQSYDPRIHDNKLYVTIKRLRKLIEPDYDKPRYIFRGKNGYYLSKNTRVLIQK